MRLNLRRGKCKLKSGCEVTHLNFNLQPNYTPQWSLFFNHTVPRIFANIIRRALTRYIKACTSHVQIACGGYHLHVSSFHGTAFLVQNSKNMSVECQKNNLRYVLRCLFLSWSSAFWPRSMKLPPFISCKTVTSAPNVCFHQFRSSVETRESTPRSCSDNAKFVSSPSPRVV